MTSLSKQWDQDAVPASHVIDMADGIREGYTETSQVFVETLDALSRDQIEAFANALPEGVEVNFTRYPNGYEFNVLAFDQETFDPVTPDMNEVAAAAEAMQDKAGGSIIDFHVNDAQWQPAGYSEIQNYDEVFAQYQNSLYREKADKLFGKVQRKENGKVRDLTEKQIIAALRRKSSDNSFEGQGNARIQRAHGAIKQRLSDFQQAEGIAKSLAEARDIKLKLFIQKNSKKLGVSPQSNDFLSSPPSRPNVDRMQQAQDQGLDFLSSPPSNPDSTYSEVNEERNAAIREEKKTVDKAAGWVKKAFKRQLTSRGLLNEQVFQAKIARDGEFGAAEIDTRMYLNSYDKAVKDAKLSEKQTALLSEAIATPLDQLNNLNVPSAVKQAIGGMRKHLDTCVRVFAMRKQTWCQTAAKKSRVQPLKCGYKARHLGIN